MKKILLFSAFYILSAGFVNSQNVTITSVTFPSLLTDTQAVQVEVSCMFTSGGCPLINSLQYASNDTAWVIAYYQVGMLSVICNETDTFNLGVLPCTFHTFYFQAIVNGGPSTDQGFFPMNITCTTVGLTETTGSNDFVVFPNPVTNELYIQMPANNSDFKISIYDMQGIKIADDKNLNSKSDTLKQMYVSWLSKGIYFLKIESQDGVSIRKLIKE